MNYQNILCVGDSLTFGARSYGCYPLHLAAMLSKRTPYAWRAINDSRSGDRARELWFRVNLLLDQVQDTFQACVLIGTNDAANSVSVDLFAEYYRQILRAFAVKKYRMVLCGEVPPVFPDGHVFFPKDSAARRDEFNEAIRLVVAESPIARLVQFPSLDRSGYEDSVHFNEEGNRRVAEAFVREILSA